MECFLNYFGRQCCNFALISAEGPLDVLGKSCNSLRSARSQVPHVRALSGALGIGYRSGR